MRKFCLNLFNIVFLLLTYSSVNSATKEKTIVDLEQVYSCAQILEIDLPQNKPLVPVSTEIPARRQNTASNSTDRRVSLPKQEINTEHMTEKFLEKLISYEILYSKFFSSILRNVLKNWDKYGLDFQVSAVKDLASLDGKQVLQLAEVLHTRIQDEFLNHGRLLKHLIDPERSQGLFNQSTQINFEGLLDQIALSLIVAGKEKKVSNTAGLINRDQARIKKQHKRILLTGLGLLGVIMLETNASPQGWLGVMSMVDFFVMAGSTLTLNPRLRSTINKAVAERIAEHEKILEKGFSLDPSVYSVILDTNRMLNKIELLSLEIDQSDQEELSNGSMFQYGQETLDLHSQINKTFFHDFFSWMMIFDQYREPLEKIEQKNREGVSLSESEEKTLKMIEEVLYGAQEAIQRSLAVVESIISNTQANYGSLEQFEIIEEKPQIKELLEIGKSERLATLSEALATHEVFRDQLIHYRDMINKMLNFEDSQVQEQQGVGVIAINSRAAIGKGNSSGLRTFSRKLKAKILGLFKESI